jgi:hypothetical protein
VDRHECARYSPTGTELEGYELGKGCWQGFRTSCGIDLGGHTDTLDKSLDHRIPDLQSLHREIYPQHDCKRDFKKITFLLHAEIGKKENERIGLDVSTKIGIYTSMSPTNLKSNVLLQQQVPNSGYRFIVIVQTGSGPDVRCSSWVIRLEQGWSGGDEWEVEVHIAGTFEELDGLLEEGDP